MKKQLLALLLCLAMVFALAACASSKPEEKPAETPAAETPAAETPAPAAPAETPKKEEPAPEPAAPAIPSIDFEDEQFGFTALYTGKANADASVISIGEFNGSKALKVENVNGKVPYVAIDVASLAGDKVADIASIELTLGVENPSGKFYAVSGVVRVWAGENLTEFTHDWSVYLETKNPKVATVKLNTAGGEALTAGNVIIVSLETDNAGTAGVGYSTLYIDNIRFADADGNTIEADTAASFVAPAGFDAARDMSNLYYLVPDAVALEGMTGISGGAWAQDGVEMTEDFLAALVPGSVIEIEYESGDGDIWIVMPWAEAGWMRVDAFGASQKNLSRNIAQIPYENIEAVCGEDKATWGAMLQCESSSDWKIYSVKVGQKSALVTSGMGGVELAGFQVKGGAWAQDGLEMTEDFLAALVPGSFIEIQYTSGDGDMWIVLPDAAAGWSRVNAFGASAHDGTVCQIPYEDIVAVCGEDKATWGARLQCESSSDWEIYSVTVKNSALKPLRNVVEIPGFQTSSGAWAQDGIELTEEQIALLVPGSVIEIQYESGDGDLWVVFPWAAAGWSRVDAFGTSAHTGAICQIPYENIVAVCGEDVSTWGAMLQCESSSDWTVFAVYIGMAG